MYTTATRTRRALLVAGVLATPLWLGSVTAGAAFAGTPAAPAAPASSGPSSSAEPSPAAADASQVVPLIVEPAVSYLEVTASGFVKDETGAYWGPYEYQARCSAFTVGSDGDLLTAGHCVDVAPGSELWQQLVAAAVQDAMAVGYTWEDTGAPITAEEMSELAAGYWSVEGDQSGSEPTVAVDVWLHGEDAPLPASVREVTSMSEGDTAVLKVNSTDLPVLELATERAAVGEDVISVGFAGISDQGSDPSESPTYRGGEITSNNRTQEGGKLPIYEISADMQSGMSGGPTVDEQGRVVGVNSYGFDGTTFNYVQPSTIALDLLPRSVDNVLSTTDVRFREGAAALVEDRPTVALAAFEEVLAAEPGYATAAELRDRAAEAVAATPAPGVGDGAEARSGEVATSTAAATQGTDSGPSSRNLLRAAVFGGWAVLVTVAAVVMALVRRLRGRGRVGATSSPVAGVPTSATSASAPAATGTAWPAAPGYGSSEAPTGAIPAGGGPRG